MPSQNNKNNKTNNEKKERSPEKRYKRVLVRVHHEWDNSQSSYSSLQSDWQTIKSEDEQVRSYSVLNKQANNQPAENNSPDQNPFAINEASGNEDGSKLEIDQKNDVNKSAESDSS